MSRRNRRFSQGRERGSIVVEFIIMAPVLVAVVYIAIVINEALERRQTTQIAIRNVSALPLSADATAFANSLQLDFFDRILSAPATENGISVIRDSTVTAEFTSYFAGAQAPPDQNDPRKAELRASRQTGAASLPQYDTSARMAAFYDGDKTVLKDASRYLGAALAPVATALDVVANSTLFFNHHDRLEIAQLTLSVPGALGVVDRGLAYLQAYSSRPKSDREANFLESKTKHAVASTSMAYMRSYAGYHLDKDEYDKQFLFGFGLGFTQKKEHSWRRTGAFTRTMGEWLDPVKGGFVTNCSMYYQAGDDCRAPNLYVTLTNLVATIAAAVDFVSYFTGTKGGKMQFEFAAKEGVNMIVDGMGEQIKTRVEDQADQRVNQVYKNEIKPQLPSVESGIHDAASKAVDGAKTIYNCNKLTSEGVLECE